jgi:CheY-like chemotaxis protein
VSGLDRELGLGTAYGVIRQSDGVVTVDSSTAAGTTLRIWLPRQDRPAETRRRADNGEPAVGGGETLMLVEDEPTVRNLARKVLARHGYTVLEAADGTEALELFGRDPDVIDLVVTDVIMPSMGGPELIRRLRAQRPDLPVLLMSGYTDDATLRRGLARSDEAFLEKPFVPATLARKVRELLDAAHASAE